MDYKLIIANINYYICKLNITRTQICENTSITIKDLNDILSYKIKEDNFSFILSVKLIIVALDLDMKKINNVQFKENLKEKIKLKNSKQNHIYTINKIENIVHIGNAMVAIIENKDNCWINKIEHKIEDIRTLCDVIENRIKRSKL